MCGIIGFIGDENVTPIIVKGLRRMEYRGYDSAGLSIRTNEGLRVIKSVGKINDLANVEDLNAISGYTGIGHTRWATHGKVNLENAHPLSSCAGEMSVVHNGIISNFQTLKKELEKEGHTFRSSTDSEVIIHLFEKYFKIGNDIKDAVLKTVNRLEGSFAFAIMLRDGEDIVGARCGTPLILGLGNNGNFLTSDILGFIEYTDKAIFLENKEIVVLGKHHFEISDFEGNLVAKEVTQVAWEFGTPTKEKYSHFTLKEILEQPLALERVISQDQKPIDLFCKKLKTRAKVVITGSGTSYHAGLYAKYVMRETAKISCDVVVSSEFKSQDVDHDTSVLVLSQSGETADALRATQIAKDAGCQVLSIVNVVGSSLARESDISLPLNCGPEVGVAATKSFTSQLALIYIIASRIGIGDDSLITSIPQKVESILGEAERIKKLVNGYTEARDFYYIARSIHIPIALEGALKMKELSYVHAEGMAAGELKHGPLALITQGTPVVVINPTDDSYQETLDNVVELKARGAKVIGISTVSHEVYDDFIPIPKVHPLLSPIIEVVPLQLIAYYAAVKMGQDPDYPRNLAKSVTVN
ncbi:MAG: glutamine--fructose-6-phosphate transaminase (isomerizing) [Thaumarchaeota archaeon]|nr:glutamine--fructose-6-phosphate transaminase (isomerizing) [Nitrososphaerota archaeon]